MGRTRPLSVCRRSRRGRSRLIAVLTAIAATAAVCGDPGAAGAQTDPTPTSELLHQDTLTDADLWDDEPRMMAAGLGFTDIIGVPGLSADDLAGSEAAVRAAGGAWNTVECQAGQTPPLSAYTSASTPMQVAAAYGFPTQNADGVPVEFSWPVLPSSLDPTDFAVTLNTGEVVTPELAALFPNAEYNERSVVVLFGTFGNRLASSDPSAEYPATTTVVADDTPLQLVGPEGPVSAVGLSADSSGSPYDDADVPAKQRAGPRLVGAKLTRLSTAGEGAPAPFDAALPNDGRALYGDKAEYRLRVYTSGGFSPDGVRAVLPTEFTRYFRVIAETEDGDEVVVKKTNHDYDVDGGELRVVGLADLGRKADVYDDCYQEDKDNYIDIVIAGDDVAVERITAVEIPAGGDYSRFYNPGGPGDDPIPDVRYTAPGPKQRQRVTVALDDPAVVTYP